MNWGACGVMRVGLALRVMRHYSIYVHARNYASPFGPATGASSARFSFISRESFEVIVSGGSTSARVKLKEIDGMAPQDVERAV